MKTTPTNDTVAYRVTILLVFLLSFLVPSLSIAFGEEKIPLFAFNSQSDYWPTKDWKTSTPESQGMSSEILSAMFDTIEQSSMNVETILIVRNGFIVVEASKHHSKRQQAIYSCTKSITAIIFGLALSNGYINHIDQPVLSFFPQHLEKNTDSQKTSLTLKHLLTMSSGLDWPEIQTDYANPENPVSQMIASEDWVDFILQQPVIHAPGSTFNYNSGCSHLLFAVLNQQGVNVADFADKNLFSPLGISNKQYIWAPGTDGIPNGSHGLYIRTRDFAKLGYLMLKGGYWEQKQLIPQKWIEESTSKQMKMTWGGMVADYYGYQWYIQPFGFNALGYGGQYLFVIPKHELVVVFLSNLGNSELNIPVDLVKDFIIPAVISSKELPECKKATDILKSKIKRFTGESP
jgi:CubicO group peptidase (beta-lactamase class C family)